MKPQLIIYTTKQSTLKSIFGGLFFIALMIAGIVLGDELGNTVKTLLGIGIGLLVLAIIALIIKQKKRIPEVIIDADGLYIKANTKSSIDWKYIVKAEPLVIQNNGIEIDDRQKEYWVNIFTTDNFTTDNASKLISISQKLSKLGGLEALNIKTDTYNWNNVDLAGIINALVAADDINARTKIIEKAIS